MSGPLWFWKIFSKLTFRQITQMIQSVSYNAYGISDMFYEGEMSRSWHEFTHQMESLFYFTQ